MAQQGGQIDVDAAIEMAKFDVEHKINLFTAMVNSCHEKCIDKRYKDGDLSVGENSCIDRCASKYWQVTGIVGQLMAGQGGMRLG